MDHIIPQVSIPCIDVVAKTATVIIIELIKFFLFRLSISFNSKIATQGTVYCDWWAGSRKNVENLFSEICDARIRSVLNLSPVFAVNPGGINEIGCPKNDNAN